MCLMGNHEAMLLGFCATRNPGTPGLLRRGADPDFSYGIRPPLRPTCSTENRNWRRPFRRRFPPHHMAFLTNLPFLFESGDILFVHAGLRPGIAVEHQKPDDLTWIREDF